MSETILEALGLKEAEAAVKSFTSQLETAYDALGNLTDTVASKLQSAIAALKELKKATNFTELTTTAKEATEQVKEYEAALKARAAQEKEIIRLTAQLAAAQSQEAVAIQKGRLELAEKNRQQKAEAQAMIAADKAMNDYASILGKAAKSVNDLREQNRQLGQIVNTLDYTTQADEIERLNKIMDGNTAIIQMNKDSYTKQKMNIGNYKSALEGAGAQIELITKKIDELTKSGNTQAEEFANLQAELARAKKQQEEYTNRINKFQEAGDKLSMQLNVVKVRMQELNSVAKKDWTPEMIAEYAELRKKAEELGTAIKRTSDEIKELSTNNLALRGMAEGVSLVTASMQLGQKAAQDLGLSTESYEEILVQLQYAQATINSLETISNALRAKSVIMVGLQSATESKYIAVRWAATLAQKALNAAQKAMPFLMAATVLVGIGKWLFDIAKGTDAAKEAQKDLNKAQTEAVKGIAEQAARIEVLAKVVAKGNVSISQQKNIITQLNQVVKDSGKEYKTWEEAQDFLVNKKDEYINALKERVKQQAVLSEYTKVYQELLGQEMEAEQSRAEFRKTMAKTNTFGISTEDMMKEAGMYEHLVNDLEESITEKTQKTKEKIEWLFKQIENIEFNGVDDVKKQYNDLIKTIDEAGKTETQKLQKKYEEQDAIIKVEFDRRIEELKKKMTAELLLVVTNLEAQKKIREKYAGLIQEQTNEQEKKQNDLYNMFGKDRLSLAQKTEDLRIRAMQDGYSKEAAALKAAKDKELKDVAQGSADYNNIVAYYQKEEIKLRKNHEKEIREINRKIEDLAIETMQATGGGVLSVSAAITGTMADIFKEYNKDVAKLRTEHQRALEAINDDEKMSAEQRAKMIKLTNEKYRQDEAELEKNFKEKQRQENNSREQTNIENRLAIVKEGSKEEYDLQVQLLEKQRENELAEAEKTKADTQAIVEKYKKLEQDAFKKLTDGRIKAEMDAAAARLEVMNEMQSEEEKALLDKYSKGLISETQYNEELAKIKDKYSVMILNDEIDNLQKILDKEELSDEQRAAIYQKLTDAKKALSDEETAHTISNIDKETEKRKKAAELAKQYAQEAFEMAMDFLSQQSEAKIEELEAELERIEQWKEAELARLAESVMSEETRAAEEKRINDQAEAERKKVEEQIRAEKVKQFRYEQLQAVANAGMNIAEGITKVIGQTGISAAVWIPIIAALGAAQIAMILSQKPPKYAKGIFGDESHKGGLAIVGDAGKKEYGLLPSGKLFETPAVPTLVDLPKYTQIFPDYVTLMQNINPIPKYEKTADFGANFEEFSEKVITAIKNNKAVQVQNVSMDKRGIWHVSNKTGTRIKYITSILKQ